VAYVDLRRYCSITENVISKALPAPREHELVYGLPYFSRVVSLRGCVILSVHPTLISDVHGTSGSCRAWGPSGDRD
jgi:hypothetical protein